MQGGRHYDLELLPLARALHDGALDGNGGSRADLFDLGVGADLGLCDNLWERRGEREEGRGARRGSGWWLLSNRRGAQGRNGVQERVPCDQIGLNNAYASLRKLAPAIVSCLEFVLGLTHDGEEPPSSERRGRTSNPIHEDV